MRLHFWAKKGFLPDGGGYNGMTNCCAAALEYIDQLEAENSKSKK